MNNYSSDEEVDKSYERIVHPLEMSLFETYKKTIERKPNSDRAEVVEQLCKFMDNDTKRFKYWLGRTKHLSPAEIYGKMKEAKGGKNPQALFNFILKKK